MNKSVLFIIIFMVIAAVAWFAFIKPARDIRMDVYRGIYPDARGLQVSGAVYMQGAPIGVVRKVYMQTDKQVMVEFEVVSGTRFRRGAKAVITADGFTGDRYINITQGTGEQLSPGNLLNTGQDSSIIENFNAKVRPAIESGFILLHAADSSMQEFSRIINTGWANRTKKDIEGLSKMATSITNTSRDAARATEQITNQIGGAYRKTDSMNMQTTALNMTIAETDQNLASIAKQDVSKTLQETGKQLNSVAKLLSEVGKQDVIKNKAFYRSANGKLDTLQQAVKQFRNDHR